MRVLLTPNSLCDYQLVAWTDGEVWPVLRTELENLLYCVIAAYEAEDIGVRTRPLFIVQGHYQESHHDACHSRQHGIFGYSRAMFRRPGLVFGFINEVRAYSIFEVEGLSTERAIE